MKRVLRRLIKVQNELEGSRFFIVGGYVRDSILGLKPKDMDIVVQGAEMKELLEALEKYGKVTAVDGRFATILFKSGRDEVQIAFPRTEKSTGPGHRDFEVVLGPHLPLEEDSSRRDFTINALYSPVDSDLKEIQDFQDGLEDINRKRLRFIGNSERRIYGDPIRMMRLLSLKGKTEFWIDNDSLDAVQNLSYLINEVPKEAVRIELEKILLSKKPSKLFILMHSVGLLRYVLPELEACIGVEQHEEFHKFDVFNHCIHVCDNTPPQLTLRLAGLLHDIGKPDVKEFNETKNRVTFYNHEIVSELKASKILRRLKFPNSIIKEVTFLISKHMYNYTRHWSGKAVRRFIRDVGIAPEMSNELPCFPLFQLRRADKKGSGIEPRGGRKVTQKQLDFEKRIREELAKQENFFTLAVNGYDIMERTGIQSSPFIGEILRFLRDQVLENPAQNEKGKLLELADEYVQEVGD